MTAASALRPATPDDAPAMCANVAEGLGSYAAWAPAGWTPPPAVSDAGLLRERFTTLPGFFALVNADASAHVVTYAAQDEPGAVHLMHLFLRLRHQGTGIAAALLARTVAEARGAGATAMRLRTPVGNARGVAFYAREGFAVAGPAEHDAGMGLDLVWLRRSL